MTPLYRFEYEYIIKIRKNNFIRILEDFDRFTVIKIKIILFYFV